ncbi:hypothetical protein KSS87_016188 [Heliosperma pusillum]|nr:hypothetical protein KSS87_016188 [Heliosperma pusillum]
MLVKIDIQTRVGRFSNCMGYHLKEYLVDPIVACVGNIPCRTILFVVLYFHATHVRVNGARYKEVQSLLMLNSLLLAIAAFLMLQDTTLMFILNTSVFSSRGFLEAFCFDERDGIFTIYWGAHHIYQDSAILDYLG